jgi:hypothetical protein
MTFTLGSPSNDTIVVDILFSLTPSVVLAHRSWRFDSGADSQGHVLPGAHALLFENHGARDDTETDLRNDEPERATKRI